jgi:hypothetical protein
MIRTGIKRKGAHDMKSRLNSFLIGILTVFIVIAIIGTKDGFSKHESITPAEDAYKMLYDLCNISGYGINSGIHPGPKADKVAKYIVEKLQAAGLKDAHLEEVKINNGFPIKFEIAAKVEGEQRSQSVSGFPLPWTVGTPQSGITGTLAYVHYGAKSDFEAVDVLGKIALIDERSFRHSGTAGYYGAAVRAKDHGAIAVILAEVQVDGPKMKWEPGTPANLFPIPCFSVGKSEGSYLRGLALSGKSHEVRFILDVPHNVMDCFNVVAKLPGNGKSGELMLVGTHYDSVFTGAIDNMNSVALMIKWAEYFAKKPKKERNRDMIFEFGIGHDSFDNNSGHYQFAARHADELKKAIVWDVDHAAGGTRYVEVDGELKPTDATSEIYTIANNYTFARLVSFYLDKNGFVNTIDAFISPAGGPAWGISPTNNPWVNSASITRFYHSMLDTPEKITLDQMKRAYTAHIEILEAVDHLPEGFLRYDTFDKTRPNTPPVVRIDVLDDTVKVGDTVIVGNDDKVFSDDKTCYRAPGVPSWAYLKFDWGDGTTTLGSGTPATHVYTAPGDYTITMSMTDTEGATSTDTHVIYVSP